MSLVAKFTHEPEIRRLRKMTHAFVSSRRIAHVSNTQDTNHRRSTVRTTAELRREGLLARIAKALASGATVTNIAEAEGIGRTLASREANSPECRQLIPELVGDEWEEMRAVFYKSMCAIEHALSARREYLTKEGDHAGSPGPLCWSRRDEALS